MPRSERSFVFTFAPRAIAAALGLAALLDAGTAAAYCRTTSCGADKGTGASCVPKQPTDCGTELFWASPCIGYSLQKDASPDVSLDVTSIIMKQAFATWTTAECPGGGHPHLSITESTRVDCRAQEYNQDKGNANLIVFRDDGWPYPATASSTLALTTVTYNLDTGEIYDGDIELNSTDPKLTTGDDDIEYDLLSIATHEAGHFLGIAHTDKTDATMFANYITGETTLRDLTDDDIAAICAAYPPAGEIPASCDTTPRHGFSELCGDDQKTSSTSGGDETGGGGNSAATCECSAVPRGGGDAAGMGVGLLGAMSLAARRRRAGRTR